MPSASWEPPASHGWTQSSGGREGVRMGDLLASYQISQPTKLCPHVLCGPACLVLTYPASKGMRPRSQRVPDLPLYSLLHFAPQDLAHLDQLSPSDPSLELRCCNLGEGKGRPAPPLAASALTNLTSPPAPPQPQDLTSSPQCLSQFWELCCGCAVAWWQGT